MNRAALRIQFELNEWNLSNDYKECPIGLSLKEDNLLQLKGEITGPPDSPYEGGKFELDINVSSSYPFVPPRFRFKTLVWHPNIVSTSGQICLDVLKNKWTPSMTLRTALLSVQVLLGSPEPNDPQDITVAMQFKNDYELFVKTARHWTSAYAKGTHVYPEFDQKIQNLKRLGISEKKARVHLSNFDWNENAAINSLQTELKRPIH